VDRALRHGARGLPGGDTLAGLLARHFGVPNKADTPPLTVEQILAWADAHHERTGQWPRTAPGGIPEAPGETWERVDAALREGFRGLTGGTSLPQLLAGQRGAPLRPRAPPLTVEQVLGWADAHHGRTGRWPGKKSGPVPGAPGEKWLNIDQALRAGGRGLPGGESLARLLARQRGVRNKARVPPLTVEQVLAWADAHRERTGRWPGRKSGPVPGAPGEKWRNIDRALRLGGRGLPGGDSLAQLLARERGAPSTARPPSLTTEQVLAWADAHRERTGRWPGAMSGPVQDAPGETWRGVDVALRDGGRGLPGGDSLARLLARERGVRNVSNPPDLTEEQVLAWADAHRERTGRWPGRESGSVPGAPGEKWRNIDQALRLGGRGLPGGDTLAQLLRRHRGGLQGTP
jgi:hypothetical protein